LSAATVWKRMLNSFRVWTGMPIYGVTYVREGWLIRLFHEVTLANAFPYRERSVSRAQCRRG
jgi:hypothetical protein